MTDGSQLNGSVMFKRNPETQNGPVWCAQALLGRGKTIGIGGSYWGPNPAFVLRDDSTHYYPPAIGLDSILLPAPSPTLLALLADLPLSGCWPAVVDRIIEEYPETEPYIRPVLEAYDAGALTQAAGA